MGILALDHVQLVMPAGREDEARRFYGEYLGMTECPKPLNLRSRGGVWFQTSDCKVKVHLGVEKDFRAAKKAHPAFLVDDVMALGERIKQAGYEVIDDEPLEGYQRLYVYDSFGNRIELMQRL